MNLLACGNVVDPFYQSADAHPDKVAVRFGEQAVSYGQLSSRIKRTATVLVKVFGVKRGDRVAYLLPNCVEIIELYYAIAHIGAVAVPLNFKLIKREVEYLVEASGSSVLVFDAQFIDKVAGIRQGASGKVALMSVGATDSGIMRLEETRSKVTEIEPLQVRCPEALSRIQYTGGSTGIPKGAARTHKADLVEFDAIIQSNGIANNPDNVVLIQCPLEHHGGHSWFTIALISGATIVVCEDFDAEQILNLIESYRVTYMILLPPTTYLRLLRCPTIDQYDLSSVCLVQSAAGATSKAMVESIYRRFPHAVLNYGWGQSESGAGTSLAITKAMLQERSPLMQSVGRPMKHVQMRIVDDNDCDLPDGQVGEALFRSESQMEGYYGQPDKTAEVMTSDGWLRTGDMMMRDEQGYLYLCSRKKDMIKSGGENVFVAEVEGVLREAPDIEDCVVFGTSDPVMGEAVAAVIQPRTGVSLNAHQVQEYCKKSIASYKKPRYVVFKDNLGRDDAGKVRMSDIVAYFDAYKEQAAPRYHELICENPKVYLIQVPYSGGTPIGYTNSYYIEGSKRNLLVDTGVSHESAYEVLSSALKDLQVDMDKTDIFLTHFHIDHLGLAAAVAAPGTVIYLSAPDEELWDMRGESSYRGSIKERLRQEGFADEELRELNHTDHVLIPRPQWPTPSSFVNLSAGDTIDLGNHKGTVVATPGHTPGHQCLYFADNKMMFYGDHVLMNSSPNIAPFEHEADSLGDYLRSLRAISGFDVRLACMAHGEVSPAKQAHAMPGRITWLIDHHHHRLEEIIEQVIEHPGISGTDVAKRISWNIPYKNWDAIPIIQRWIIGCETLAHLDHLVGEGRVRVVQDGPTRRYFVNE